MVAVRPYPSPRGSPPTHTILGHMFRTHTQSHTHTHTHLETILPPSSLSSGGESL